MDSGQWIGWVAGPAIGWAVKALCDATAGWVRKRTGSGVRLGVVRRTFGKLRWSTWLTVVLLVLDLAAITIWTFGTRPLTRVDILWAMVIFGSLVVMAADFLGDLARAYLAAVREAKATETPQAELTATERP